MGERRNGVCILTLTVGFSGCWGLEVIFVVLGALLNRPRFYNEGKKVMLKQAVNLGKEQGADQTKVYSCDSESLVCGP